MSGEYWIRYGKVERGPFTTHQVRQFAAEGRLKSGCQLSADKTKWIAVEKVRGIELSEREQSNHEPVVEDHQVSALPKPSAVAPPVIQEWSSGSSVAQRLRNKRRASKNRWLLASLVAMVAIMGIATAGVVYWMPKANSISSPDLDKPVAQISPASEREVAAPESRQVVFTDQRLNEGKEFLLGEVVLANEIREEAAGIVGTIEVLVENRRRSSPRQEFLSVCIPLDGRNELTLNEGFRVRDREGRIYSPIGIGLNRTNYVAFDYSVALTAIGGIPNNIYASCADGKLESLMVGEMPEEFFLLFDVRSDETEFRLTPDKKEFELSRHDQRWYLEAVRASPFGHIADGSTNVEFVPPDAPARQPPTKMRSDRKPDALEPMLPIGRITRLEATKQIGGEGILGGRWRKLAAAGNLLAILNVDAREPNENVSFSESKCEVGDADGNRYPCLGIYHPYGLMTGVENISTQGDTDEPQRTQLVFEIPDRLGNVRVFYDGRDIGSLPVDK